MRARVTSVLHSIDTCTHRNLPLLNFVESLQLGDGDEDDDGLLATTNINLFGSRDLEGSKFSLELGNAVLQVNESLGDIDLDGLGDFSGGVCGAHDLGRYLCRHDGLFRPGRIGELRSRFRVEIER